MACCFSTFYTHLLMNRTFSDTTRFPFNRIKFCSGLLMLIQPQYMLLFSGFFHTHYWPWLCSLLAFLWQQNCEDVVTYMYPNCDACACVYLSSSKWVQPCTPHSELCWHQGDVTPRRRLTGVQQCTSLPSPPTRIQHLCTLGGCTAPLPLRQGKIRAYLSLCVLILPVKKLTIWTWLCLLQHHSYIWCTSISVHVRLKKQTKLHLFYFLFVFI